MNCPGSRCQSARLVGELFHPREKGRLDACSNRRVGEAGRTEDVRVRQIAGKLEQSQRIPAALRDDPVADPIVQSRDSRGRQQCNRIRLAQRAELQLRQRRQLVTRVLVGFDEEQDDRLGVQTTRDERQHLRGRMIEPVRVVDDADERPCRSSVRQQRQNRERHE